MADRVLGPKALDDSEPIVGVVIAKRFEDLRIEAHLGVLVAVAGADDVDAEPPASDVVHGGGHLREYRRVNERWSDRCDQAKTRGHRAEPGHERHRLDGVAPEVRLTAEAPPL